MIMITTTDVYLMYLSYKKWMESRRLNRVIYTYAEWLSAERELGRVRE